MKKTMTIENIEIFVLMLVSSFCFTINSPLHILTRNDSGIDSSVFKTIALMMERGYMPYRDSFDHKGPLLYVINWLGNRISGYRGIWIIEILFLTVAFFMMYKIARFICNRSSSLIATFAAITILFPYYEGGNFTEEYAMTFIAIALWIFLDYFINNRITVFRLIVCGLTFGSILMLRPNMIAVFVALCLAVLVKCLKEKTFLELGSFILWFLIGAILIMTPLLIWLGINGALGQFFQDYIIFNQQYTSSKVARAVFSAKWNSFFTFFNTTVFVIAFCSQVYFCRKSKKLIDIAYLLLMIVTLIFICVSGMVYGHYGMIIVPTLVYPIAQIFKMLELIENASISQALILITSLYLLSVIILPPWIEIIKIMPTKYDQLNDVNHISPAVQQIAACIDEMKLDSKEKISVYGNWDFVYVYCNRVHATRYSYQYPIAEVMPEILEDYMIQLQYELPPVIVVQEGYYDDTIGMFLEENDYELSWSEEEDNYNGALLFTRQ